MAHKSLLRVLDLASELCFKSLNLDLSGVTTPRPKCPRGRQQYYCVSCEGKVSVNIKDGDRSVKSVAGPLSASTTGCGVTVRGGTYLRTQPPAAPAQGVSWVFYLCA